MPDLDDEFEQGEFGALREWLRERLGATAASSRRGETLERVVGGAARPRAVPALPAREAGAIYGRSEASGRARTDRR